MQEAGPAEYVLRTSALVVSAVSQSSGRGGLRGDVQLDGDRGSAGYAGRWTLADGRWPVDGDRGSAGDAGLWTLTDGRCSSSVNQGQPVTMGQDTASRERKSNSRQFISCGPDL